MNGRNCFETIFAGSSGLSNLLAALLGTEAVIEYRYERVAHPEKGTAEEDVGRQILPVLIKSESNRAGSEGLLEQEAELALWVPAANLRHPIAPDRTRVLFRGRAWRVTESVPLYAGGIVHLWELKLKEI